MKPTNEPVSERELTPDERFRRAMEQLFNEETIYSYAKG